MMTPDPIIEEMVTQIIHGMNDLPVQYREGFLLFNLHALLQPMGDLWIYGVIAMINQDFEGHAKDPIVIAALEMLEGMLALRRILA